jgi:Acetyltransferase (GNAT) domain
MNGSSPTSADAELLARYDQLVERSPQGSVFVTSWWLDAVEPGGWRMHCAEKGEELVAAWPTLPQQGRFGTMHLGAQLCPFLGPLLPPAEGHRRRAREIEAIGLLLDAIGPYAHLEARCNPAFDYWTPLRWRGFSQTTLYTWRIEDLSDLDAVFAGFGEKARGHIRAAEKRGVVVQDAGLDDFLELHEQRGRRPHAAAVRRVDAAASERGARDILVARDAGGAPCAGCYLAHDQRYSYFLMSATTGEVRGAGSAVVWESIKRAAARGNGFDFEGSVLPHVEPFVRSFGGAPTPYSIVRHTPSRALRAERAVKRSLRELRRQL